MSKSKRLKLKCSNCKTSKVHLSDFIVKNDYDNTYLEVINFLPALQIFSKYHKENEMFYGKIMNTFFHSSTYFCSKKCMKIYKVKQ